MSRISPARNGLITWMAAPLTLVALVGAACERDIPRPPSDPDPDGGSPMPSEVRGVDAAPAPPDLGPDLPPPATCGGPGQTCCPGNVCASGGCCLEGRCVANGTPCRADATCLNGSCGGCGGPVQASPQVCCDQRVCTASRTACAGDAPGMCLACGAGGQTCCGDGFCEAGFTCDSMQMAPLGLCVPK